MATHIRLTRLGSKNRPFYRIIVLDSRKKREGEYIELIGTHDVLKEETKINKEIALKWLGEGAQPSDTVRTLFKDHGVMMAFDMIKNNGKSLEEALKAVEKMPIAKKKKAKVKLSKKAIEKAKAEKEAKAAPKVETPKVEETKPAEEPKVEEAK